MDEKTVTFVDGTEVPIRPVSRALIEQIGLRVKRALLAEGKPMDPPQYKVITASGEVETFPHDEKSIVDAPEDEKLAWAKHLEAKAEFDTRYNFESIKFQLMRGLVVSEVPKAWIKEQESEEFEIPKDPKELLWVYLERELLDTPEDVIRALTAIAGLSMRGSVTEEALKAAEATFRSAMERPTPGDAATAEGEVGLHPRLRRGRGNARLGQGS